MCLQYVLVLGGGRENSRCFFGVGVVPILSLQASFYVSVSYAMLGGFRILAIQNSMACKVLTFTAFAVLSLDELCQSLVTTPTPTPITSSIRILEFHS